MATQLPPALLASLQQVAGFDEALFVSVHSSGEQVVSIRANPAKLDVHHLPFVSTGPVPWCPHGRYLAERPSFTTDPLFHAGAYYVQEASSMFLEQAISQCCDLSQPLSVLDLCAAPGGKSTLIQSLLSADSLLVSNEVIKTRVNILAENITKWGAANVLVTSNDAKDMQRIPAFFDLVVVDAPCSGSGLFRKDPEAIEEWSLNNVELCSQRQQRILADVLPALKPGGILIYATCSYSQKEDEDIMDNLVADHQLQSLPLVTSTGPGIVATISAKEKAHGYRFYPDKVKGEGFFIAAFKNTAPAVAAKEIKSRTKPVRPGKEALAVIGPYLKDAALFSFLQLQDEVLAIPAALYEKVLLLQATLYLKKAGVKLGTVIRNELVPDHELALSTIGSAKITGVEADLQTALQYLRKKDIVLNTDHKGWAILTYRSLPLGLIKILPNRVNNHYPKDWRILNK